MLIQSECCRKQKWRFLHYWTKQASTDSSENYPVNGCVGSKSNRYTEVPSENKIKTMACTVFLSIVIHACSNYGFFFNPDQRLNDLLIFWSGTWWSYRITVLYSKQQTSVRKYDAELQILLLDFVCILQWSCLITWELTPYDYLKNKQKTKQNKTTTTKNNNKKHGHAVETKGVLFWLWDWNYEKLVIVVSFH